MIRISAFKWVPPFAQGVVRDLRVRWALEEAGLPYEARLIDPEVQKSPDYRRQQRGRLTDVATWLGGREYLEGRFTAGDLMMTPVLRILRHTDVLDAYPTLKAYKERCEARPAFQRALAAQLEPFGRHGA